MGPTDFEFPLGQFLFAITVTILGAILLGQTFAKIDLTEELGRSEMKVVQLEGEIREILQERDAVPAEITVEMVDSNMPHKVYYFTIKGTTGKQGTYPLKDVRIREEAE